MTATPAELVAAAERRADLNIHAARQERDNAVDSFRAELWSAVGPYLSVVSDPTPGETFDPARCEMLAYVLREVRDALRATGVVPAGR